MRVPCPVFLQALLTARPLPGMPPPVFPIISLCQSMSCSLLSVPHLTQPGIEPLACAKPSASQVSYLILQWQVPQARRLLIPIYKDHIESDRVKKFAEDHTARKPQSWDPSMAHKSKSQLLSTGKQLCKPQSILEIFLMLLCNAVFCFNGFSILLLRIYCLPGTCTNSHSSEGRFCVLLIVFCAGLK